MNAWLIALLLAAAVGAGLALTARPKRGGLYMIGVALMLALAGYAWQGNPGLGGSPTQPDTARRGRETLFGQERKVWLETVGFDALQLDGADAFIRNGDPAYAVGLLNAWRRKEPGSMMLWLGLGNALQAQADGMLTPAALYAFQQAATAAPRGHPAPAYFLGLAYLQQGDVEEAQARWRALLDSTPADAPWRARLQARLSLLQRFRAES